MTFTSLGITFSPYVVNFFAGFIGEINGTTGLLAAGYGQIVCFVIEVLYCFFLNKNSQIGK
jgi:hypothetical protein